MLSASVNQYLSLVMAFAVIFSSFIAWPPLSSWLISCIFYLLLLITFSIFIKVLFMIRNWQCRFSLNKDGHGILNAADAFHFAKRPFISPFICILYIEFEDKYRDSIWVWSDMLNDSQYRLLCRLANHVR
nr:protein YgfX [Shewanella aestuarii]